SRCPAHIFRRAGGLQRKPCQSSRGTRRSRIGRGRSTRHKHFQTMKAFTMKRNISLILLASLGLLAGCGKPDEKPEAKAEAKSEKRDANIVTLTKENLEHVELKIEPAALGNLGMTLKAVGRVSANLNKTAKVTSTLEGRLVKLNFDLNDRVKAGDVLGLVETPELLGRPLELKAPIEGVIVLRNSTVGELVDKSKEIYTISDPANLWVIA